MKLNHGGIFKLVLFAAALAASLSAAAQDGATVFKIGAFNRSSAEFSQDSPAANVNFVVSQGTAAKDWFAAQPAVLAAKPPQAGPASAPRVISFALPHAPAVAYRLHIALLIESSNVPALKVEINGKSGWFYLHPEHNYDSGDQTDSFDPAYAAADVDFTFPGNYLHAGANTISLQPVEDADEAVPDAAIN